jgi:hypothetical protein
VGWRGNRKVGWRGNRKVGWRGNRKVGWRGHPQGGTEGQPQGGMEEQPQGVPRSFHGLSAGCFPLSRRFILPRSPLRLPLRTGSRLVPPMRSVKARRSAGRALDVRHAASHVTPGIAGTALTLGRFTAHAGPWSELAAVTAAASPARARCSAIAVWAMHACLRSAPALCSSSPAQALLKICPAAHVTCPPL